MRVLTNQTFRKIILTNERVCNSEKAVTWYIRLCWQDMPRVSTAPLVYQATAVCDTLATSWHTLEGEETSTRACKRSYRKGVEVQPAA